MRPLEGIVLRLHERRRQAVLKVISKSQKFYLDILEFQDLIDSKLSKKLRSAWAVIVVFCFSACCFQVVDRIQYYLSYPVAVDIGMDEMTSLKMPDMKACASENEFFDLFLNGKSWNIITCAIPVLWIWGENMNTSYGKVWEYKNYSNTVERVEYKKNLLNSTTVNIYREISFLGQCTVASVGTLRGKQLAERVVVHSRKGKCTPSVIIASVVDKIDFRYAFPIISGYDYDMNINLRSYEFRNTPPHPCGSDESFEKFYKNCFKSKVSSRTSCRFPFFDPRIKHPPCNSSNVTIAHKNYLNYMRTILIPELEDCKCLRTCNQLVYNVLATINAGTSAGSAVSFIVGDTTAMQFTERLAYDTISLLTDVGGSLGLFMGLSLLSILDILQKLLLWSKQKYQSYRLTDLEVVIQRHLIKVISVPQHENSETIWKNKFAARILHRGILLVCICLAGAMILHRTTHYLAHPRQNVVAVEVIKNITFSSVTVCGVNDRIARLKKMYAAKKNVTKNWCDVDILELYRLQKKYSFDVIWKNAELTSLPKVHQQTEKITSIPLMKYNRSVIATHLGNCRHYTFSEVSHAGMFTLFAVVYISYSPLQIMECPYNAYTTFTADPRSEDYEVFSAIDMPVHSSVLNEMRMKKIKRLNTQVHRCVTKQQYDQCKKDCLKQKLQNTDLCKLPFIRNKMAPCDSIDSAKMSRRTYLTIVLDEMHKCQCSRPCEETNYLFYSFTQPQQAATPFGIVFGMLSNIIENFIEVEQYPFIALCCDIGNILGLAVATFILILARYLRALLTWFFPNVK